MTLSAPARTRPTGSLALSNGAEAPTPERGTGLASRHHALCAQLWFRGSATSVTWWFLGNAPMLSAWPVSTLTS